MSLSDDGLGTAAIMAATGKSKTSVWDWQERIMAEGVYGLLRDRTRQPGIAGDIAGRQGRGADAGAAQPRAMR